MGIFDPNGDGKPLTTINVGNVLCDNMVISDEGVIYAIINNTNYPSRVPTQIVAIQGHAPLAKSGWPRKAHDNRNTFNINKGLSKVDGDYSYDFPDDYSDDEYDSSDDVVAGVLHGLRWEMPCNNKGNVCSAKVQKPTESATLGGDPNQLYEVTLRFRGVVEYQSYTGGKKDGLWYIGGRSNQGSYNIYQLETTDPPQTYFLNAERAGIGWCWPIDYTRKIRVKGGSKVILSANAQDGALISNHDGKGNPIIIPGIDPAPAAYDGQFIQMDVLSVEPIVESYK